MKATGIVRKVDNLGRIVIPKETRKTLQVETSDALEFFVEEDAIVLQKY
ncbi:AbrB/MazE/SpoVT family DNA-binding domain-containing protein, partial [Bacillus thuringiensis]|nr:AbrB/MazE/SpoVT family DNA-binding domain-containing protein [Bacillus thuringiensis]